MVYFKFLIKHPRLLSFGVLLTLFSSFGQTFLISVFVPQILNEFSLNSGQFGTLYAAATLCSALSLPYFGKLLDRSDLGRYTRAVGIALVLSCWLLALSPNVTVLFLALLGLRLSGQGLLGLTASTAMVRLFVDFRGRALSISGLGYPLGEGVLPILVVVLLQRYGWRISWGIAGLFIALVFLPLIEHLIKDARNIESEKVRIITKWSRKRLLTDRRFYLLLPTAVTMPFLLTGFFLYQTALADFKGWSAPMMASGFTAFAAFRMFSSIAVGPWVDRLGPARMFPLSIVPLALGVALLWLQSAGWALYAFFILAGISTGVGGVIMTALWSHCYGAAVLGSVKSVVAMMAVFSTAASPLFFGWLLAGGVSFAYILPGAFAICLLTFSSGTFAYWFFFRTAIQIPNRDL